VEKAEMSTNGPILPNQNSTDELPSLRGPILPAGISGPIVPFNVSGPILPVQIAGPILPPSISLG